MLFYGAQSLACSPDVDKDNMKATLESAIKGNGLETEIRNIVFHLIRNSFKNEIKSVMASVVFIKYINLKKRHTIIKYVFV